MPNLHDNGSDTPAEFYRRGMEYLQRQCWQEAVDAFRELIRIDPGYRDVWQRLSEAKEGARGLEDLQDLYNAGKADYGKEQWERAVSHLSRLVSLSKDYKDAGTLLREAKRQLELQTLYSEARMLIEEEKWTQAIEVLDKIVRIDRTYQDAQETLDLARSQCRLHDQYRQALSYSREENWSEAVKCFEVILEENPEYKDVVNRLEEAKKQEELATLYSAGVGFLETGRWGQAIDRFREIIRLAGVYKDVADKLAKAHRQQELARLSRRSTDSLRQGDLEHAVRALKKIYEVAPDYPDIQTRLADAERQLRLTRLRDRGEASVRAENWQEAVEAFEELRKLDPGDDNVITRLAEVKGQLELDRLFREGMGHLQQRKWRKAVIALEGVIRRDPNYRDAKAQLEIAREQRAQDNLVVEFLSKPLWQGIGGVAAVIALVLALFPSFRGAFPDTTIPTPTPRPVAICNGDFESNFECWQQDGELDRAIECVGRQCYAVLGDPGYACEGGVPLGEARIKQSFKVSETVSPTLSLRYRVFSYDILSDDLEHSDFFEVSINGNPVVRFGNTEWDVSDCNREVWDSGWQLEEFDLSLYRGESVELSLRNVNGTDEWWNTWTWVDDVESR
jgi:tetratricopeptide (TPR) repeat protein